MQHDGYTGETRTAGKRFFLFPSRVWLLHPEVLTAIEALPVSLHFSANDSSKEQSVD